MKPLYLLMPRERALYIHQLFPDEMPFLLTLIHDFALTFLEKDDIEISIELHGLPFAQWQGILKQLRSQIESQQKLLERDATQFSALLFTGYIGMFAKDCILIYLSTTKHRNHNFMLALEMFFKPLQP